MYEVRPFFKPVLAVIDAFGYAGFWWLKLRKFKEPKKVLCIVLGHIGDVLLTTPALRALRARFPDSRIDVLVRSFAKEVLEGNKNVNRVVAFDAPWLGIYGAKAGISQTIRFVRKLRSENYDLVIDFHSDPRNSLVSFLVGKYRVGYGIRGFGFLLNKAARLRPGRHEIDRHLDLVRALGTNGSREMDFPIPANAKNRAKKLLSSAKGKLVVGITPAAGKRRYKYWLAERWAELADRLIEKYDARIVITGGKSDLEDVDDILAVMKNTDKVINLAGKTSLKDLGAVISECDLFVSPDTATAHIARALRVPLITIMSLREDPERWGYDEGKFRRIAKPEMNGITVKEVLAMISELGVLDAQ